MANQSNQGGDTSNRGFASMDEDEQRITPNSITGNIDAGLTQRAGLAAQVIVSMTATLNGTQVGLFLPPPTGVPSDAVADAERFFSFWSTKGTADDLKVLFADFMNGYFHQPTVSPCNLPPH